MSWYHGSVKCYYHYYFVAVYLLEIVEIAKACKLVIGMAQTSIMSACANYIKVLYLPIIHKLLKLIKWLASNFLPGASHYLDRS